MFMCMCVVGICAYVCVLACCSENSSTKDLQTPIAAWHKANDIVIICGDLNFDTARESDQDAREKVETEMVQHGGGGSRALVERLHRQEARPSTRGSYRGVHGRPVQAQQNHARANYSWMGL